jgi:hypothetical protein
MSSEMEIYTIHIPVVFAARNKVWREDVLRIADGYSHLGQISGAWRDPATGRDYIEPMDRYEIAATPKCMANVLRATAAAFPDEVCFYVVLRGKPYFIHPARLETDVAAMNGNVAPRHQISHPGTGATHLLHGEHGVRVLARHRING